MADITPGLNESNKIYLFSSSTFTIKIVEAEKVVYTWESVGGKVEESIDGQLSENWHSERLLIEVTIILPRTAFPGTDISTDWLFNMFLKDKFKKYKEHGWAYYIDVVLDMKNVKIINWKNINKRSRLTLKFKKKTVGLTI